MSPMYKEDLKIIGIGVGFFVVAMFLVGLGVMATRTQECKAISEFMDMEYRYSVWTDCMIKVDDKWIPLRNYRVQDGGHF